MSRAYTADEIRKMLIDQARAFAAYWDNVERQTTREKIEGAIFSLLSTLDGSSVGLPAFDLVVRPHEEDKQFHIDNGENWFEDGTVINETASLHEDFVKRT